MNSGLTEQYLINIYNTFTSDKDRILNELKNDLEEKEIKQLYKEINMIHSIGLNILKLNSSRKKFEEKKN